MNVQSINQALESVRYTDTVDSSFFQMLRSFKQIVLRGAGGFGKEIGQALIERGFATDNLLYWDVRADDLKSLNGIRVSYPFSEELQCDDVLIIHCIPNGSLSGTTIMRELHDKGYTNVIDGMALFESAFCDMRAEVGFDPKNCLDTTACNWTNCERLLAFSERDRGNPKLQQSSQKLSFQVMDVFLSFKCTLGCKDCGAYMNVYTDKGLDTHVPYQQIKHDIDAFFDVIDTVAFVSVIGGEPFLHPDFPQIIADILEKTNFGVLGITTSGICKISDEAIQVLKNNRTRVIFSDYTRSLTSKQKQLFQQNVEKIKTNGIHYTTGEPVWATTPSLMEKTIPTEQLASMKASCNSTKTCQALLNGRLYPCSTSLAVHELHADDYPSDYISLDSPNLRHEITALHNRLYYESCARCSDGGAPVAKSGVQAKDDRFAHLLDKIAIVSTP